MDKKIEITGTVLRAYCEHGSWSREWVKVSSAATGSAEIPLSELLDLVERMCLELDEKSSLPKVEKKVDKLREDFESYKKSRELLDKLLDKTGWGD